LAQARVLAASFEAHHPGTRFVALVVDGDASDQRRAGTPEILLPGDLGLPGGQWEQMAGVYSVMELATAAKAALLRHLLTAGAGTDAVLYLDPDIVVYQPFPEVAEAARRSGIALTPHVLHPVPRDGLQPAERDLMHAGLFNLGFIGVGRGALDFLDWWHERLRLDAVVDLPNALFTDQRWVDWVPSLFGGEVLRDKGLNVAYWNLHERPLTENAAGTVLAGGQPLRFFHFSGYEPARPWQLSKHAAADPRCDLVDHPVVARLCAAYADALAAAGHAELASRPYRLDVAPNGLRLTPTVRAAYRAGIQAALTQREAVPPSPFAGDGGAGFTRWLLAPDATPPLGPWHHQVWRQRPDLRAAFPDPGGRDATGFQRWFATDPGGRQLHHQLDVPGGGTGRRLLPLGFGGRSSRRHQHLATVTRPPVDLDPGGAGRRVPLLPYGWNVVGYLSAENGMGEAGRRMNLAVEGAGIATQPVAVSSAGARQQHHNRRHPGDGRRYRDSLFCVNADETERAVALTGGDDPSPDRGRRIGYWFWEVDRFPDRWPAAGALLDEVWCASAFTAAAISATTPLPVRVVPLPVWAPSRPTPFTRQQLGMPEDFVFLFSYSFDSVFERKNPLGLVDAYRRAFGPADGAHLVLKSIGGRSHPEQLHRVRQAAEGRADIVVSDGYIDAHRMQGLVERSDCFVSLHRSEGFGLHLAAAMAAGRPVIATGYSGNLTFMDAGSAFLVPYELVPVGPGSDPYPPAAHWASPDLDAAASLMRRVFDDPADAARVGALGHTTVLDHQGLDRAAAAVGSMLLSPDRTGAGSIDEPRGLAPASSGGSRR
jgi:glycosyltransferase involved in cell wall biosynthesis